MEVKWLALCVPTYNRADVIACFLEKYAAVYREYHVDIYIYDSSDHDETEKVVTEFRKRYSGIFLERIPSSVHSNKKVYEIYRRFGREKAYEYVWVSADHTWWTEQILKELQSVLKKSYDLVVVNGRDCEKIGRKEYTDRNELFIDCAWHMTMYGAAIVKVSTMLKEVPWDELSARYLVKERINHSHVALYFEQIARLEHFCALHLPTKAGMSEVPPVRLTSGWKKETFSIWISYWESMIQMLPECYTRKEEVIRKHGIYSKVFSYQGLEQARMDHILNVKIYGKWIGKWHRYTDVKEHQILLLSVAPPILVKNIKQHREHLRKERWKRRIKKFCSKFKKIYIYGCGGKAKEYIAYLDELGIPYYGHVVSSMDGNSVSFNHHPVSLLTEEILQDKTVGIIMALGQGNWNQVMKNEEIAKIKQRLFSEYVSSAR